MAPDGTDAVVREIPDAEFSRAVVPVLPLVPRLVVTVVVAVRRVAARAMSASSSAIAP